MMISRFFFPEPLPKGGEVRLPDALAHHAGRVLRLRDGDSVILFDGQGGEVPATLVFSGKQCRAALGEWSDRERESPLRLVLVQALASGDKMDWIVQKAVELGAAGVIPVRAERSVIRLSGDRAARRVEHWRQVAIAACEQSGRNRIPFVAEIVELGGYLDSSRAIRSRLFLAPSGGNRFEALSEPGPEIHMLIGPEGGWSEGEAAACRAAGCTPVLLGPRILRTETAGLAAISAIQARWGDF